MSSTPFPERPCHVAALTVSEFACGPHREGAISIDEVCRLFLDEGAAPGDGARRVIELPVCDQYTLQGDAFSDAIRRGEGQALPLEDSVANMRVLDAVRQASS